MTSGQRKAHKVLWLLLVIIIPAIIVFAVKDLDIFNPVENEFADIESSKKKVLKSSENELIKVSLYENSIEIILKSALKNSSSVVYGLDDNEKKGQLIGQISNVGIYSFKTSKQLKGIVVFDVLKETEITKLIF